MPHFLRPLGMSLSLQNYLGEDRMNEPEKFINQKSSCPKVVLHFWENTYRCPSCSYLFQIKI